jgi:PAS domain S-box-containing protein
MRAQLEALVRTAETQCEGGVRGCVLLLDAEGLRLRQVAAPHLSAALASALDGMALASQGSACAAALQQRQTVVVDIASDPRWAEQRQAALAHGLRACWSTPIVSSSGGVLGSLALFLPEPGSPTPRQRELIELVAQTAALVVERGVEALARERAERQLCEEMRISETLNRLGETLAAELDLATIVQAVTDGATQLTGAEFGAFFYNVSDQSGESYMLYALSGVSREAFSKFPLPRNTAIFERTFRGEGTLRLDDVTADPRYGRNAPYQGIPEGHLPVRSYLAAPVVASGGEVIGGLLFGHSAPARFTERHEQLMLGMAGQTAIAIDNARLIARLRDSADRLSLALLATDLGDWSWDARSGLISLSDQAAQLFGLPLGALLTHEQRLAVLHPEDRAPVRAAFQAAVEAGTRYVAEYRVARADGSEGWVSAHGTPQFGPDGQVASMFGVVQDVTQRKRMESELRERAAQLAEADRRKDEFLATLAHELRNPLAPLLTSLELMRRAGSNEDVKEKARSVMTRQVGQMVRLIDELIDIARITSGKIELRKERLELRTVIESALEIARPLVDQWRHELSVELPQQPVFLDVDRTRAAQVLSNVLNNAAKYTRPQGRIGLRATVQGDSVVLEVRDNGVGIAPDMLARIFDMFAQGGRTTEQSQGGLGVGLSLSRRLIELHGGTLEARSDGLDRGSEFTIRLPLARASNADTSLDSGRAVSASARRRVLVVDDNVDAADSMAMMLGMDGHDVHTAHDGPQALDAVDRLAPDLVLLDIGLPSMNGYEVAGLLRERHPHRRMSLVAATGWSQDKDRELSREAGFDHHLVKPLDIEAVRQLIAATPVPVAAPLSDPADTAEPASGVRPRVLIVDDSALIQESAQAMLESEGYEVRTASDGFEAIDIVRAWKPNVVFLDVQMPRMNGIETARALRAQFPGEPIGLLMMSGVALNETWLRHAKAAGFDGCIEKTAAPQVWLQQLRSHARPAAGA